MPHERPITQKVETIFRMHCEFLTEKDPQKIGYQFLSCHIAKRLGLRMSHVSHKGHL
jgi:hypothetical protein